MPSTSKSSRQWQVKQPKRNWLDLPLDVTANIIQRIGVFDILENAQKVCTTWHRICKDPAMWRVIHMDYHSDPDVLCKNAVDWSQGQLVDITMVGFRDDELLEYIASRSPQLRRLEIAFSYDRLYESLTEALKKFPLLEELSFYKTDVSEEAIETACKYCPLLKVLKLNENLRSVREKAYNEIAIAIGKNLGELRHLELVLNNMSNIGLQAILDGCCHLELLDLRQCFYIDLRGDIGKRCSEQIKSLKLPLEGRPLIQEYDYSDDEYYGYFNYVDYVDFTFSDDDFTSSDDDFDYYDYVI